MPMRLHVGRLVVRCPMHLQLFPRKRWMCLVDGGIDDADLDPSGACRQIRAPIDECGCVAALRIARSCPGNRVGRPTRHAVALKMIIDEVQPEARSGKLQLQLLASNKRRSPFPKPAAPHLGQRLDSRAIPVHAAPEAQPGSHPARVARWACMFPDPQGYRPAPIGSLVSSLVEPFVRAFLAAATCPPPQRFGCLRLLRELSLWGQRVVSSRGARVTFASGQGGIACGTGCIHLNRRFTASTTVLGGSALCA